MFYILCILCILTFILTLYLTKKWIWFAKRKGIIGKDVNKYGFPEVPEAGGVAAVFSVYVALVMSGFLLPEHSFQLISLVLVTVCGAIVGIADDFLGWKKGLSQGIKPIIMYFAGLSLAPLGLQVFKNSSLTPFISLLPYPNIIYALILVPVGVLGASNAVNLYAGYDGLLPGSMAIIFGAIAIKAYINGNIVVFYTAAITLSAILAFLYYNKYPARVFPGNVFPFSLGSLFAGLVITGGIEIFGVLLILPHFIEAILHARKWFKVENFGIPQPDGTIKPKYDKIYSIAHILHRIPGMTEKKITTILLALSTVSACIAFALT